MRQPRTPSSPFSHPLDLLLGTAVRVRTLRVLSGEREGLRAADIARAAGVTVGAAQDALTPLVEAGLVAMRGAGRGASYRMHEGHPFTGPLGALFTVERERRAAVFEVVEAWVYGQCPRPVAVWWFGSTARGDDSLASDVDLAVIGPEDHAATRALEDGLHEALEPVRARYALQPNVVAYSTATIRQWPPEDAAMWDHLVRDAVPLYGPGPERLRAMVNV